MSDNNGKFDIVSKMTIIGVVAVVIIIAAILVVTLLGKGDTKPKSDVTKGTIVTDTSQVTKTDQEQKKEIDRALAVVKYVDVSNNQLMIYDIEKLATITLVMDSAIEIKDEYGTDIALTQLELGDMVETKYEVNSLKPEYVRITGVTWQRKDVSNMVVDTEGKTITIANETYTYTDELITSDNGIPFDILDLSTADEALVKGYKDHVWSIVLLNGHGTLKLTNHSAFVGGNLEVGNTMTVAVEANMSIPVTAGVHNVVVSKEGMAPFVTQVMVNEDAEVVLDLSEAQPKVGIVEFVLLQEDVQVYMDDELVDMTQEIKLDFGTFKIRAEKEGFTPWESELELNQAYIQFKIDLEKTPTFLHINQPVGAELYMDGELVGIIPVKTVYKVGTHKIFLRQDGYHTFSQDFYWSDNGKDEYLALPAMTPLVDETKEEEPVEEPTIEGEVKNPEPTQ